MPTDFQGSKGVRGGLKQRKYQVKARYQVRANALLYLAQKLRHAVRPVHHWEAEVARVVAARTAAVAHRELEEDKQRGVV